MAQIGGFRPRWCAHYDCDALWIQNFQDGCEGREILQVICFIFSIDTVLSLDRFSRFHKVIFV